MYLFLWMGIWMAGIGQGNPLAPAVYQEGVSLFQQKKYKQSKQIFLRILPALEKAERKPGISAKQRHLMRLGRCDLLFYLGQIAWQRKRLRLACRRYQQLNRHLSTLPAVWKNWSIQPHLLEHMAEGQQALTRQCPKVRPLLLLKSTPKAAKLAYRYSSTAAWVPLPQKRLVAAQARVFVKAEAAGYLPTQMRVTLKPWQALQLMLTLRKRPRPRRSQPLLVRRLPPPRLTPPPTSTPFYTTWWFWTATGVIVVGGVTATVLVLTLPQDLRLGSDARPPVLWQ